MCRGDLKGKAMFSVYVLLNKAGTRTYVGQTGNLAARLARHNAGYEDSTRSRGPWECIYTETFATRGKAMTREKWFKTRVGRQFIREVIEAHRVRPQVLVEGPSRRS